MRTWNKGWPPFTGWWNMSPDRNKREWRWVEPERKFISEVCFNSFSAKFAAQQAVVESILTIDDFEFTNCWPEGARVPRIDPRGLPCS